MDREGSLAGYSLWGCKELDITHQLTPSPLRLTNTELSIKKKTQNVCLSCQRNECVQCYSASITAVPKFTHMLPLVQLQRLPETMWGVSKNYPHGAHSQAPNVLEFYTEYRLSKHPSRPVILCVYVVVIEDSSVYNKILHVLQDPI